MYKKQSIELKDYNKDFDSTIDYNNKYILLPIDPTKSLAFTIVQSGISVGVVAVTPDYLLSVKIHQDFRRQGIFKQLIPLLFKNLIVNKLKGVIHRENLPSILAALGNGFCLEKNLYELKVANVFHKDFRLFIVHRGDFNA